MAHPRVITFYDAIRRAIMFLGGNASQGASETIRYAVQDALREITEAKRWTYLLKPDRIRVPAPQTSSTITYDHTGGSSERLVTLASGSWPSWAANGAIQFNGDGVWHRVASSPSSSTLSLDENLNPGDDLAALTTYKLIQCYYPLPADFVSLDQPYEEDLIKVGRDRVFNNWLAKERFGEGSGHPRAFEIVGHPTDSGRLALWSLYEPTVTEELDFIYYRRPRELYHSGYEKRHYQGTIATASNTTITGTGTAFDASMEGAILRVSRDSNIPTGIDGLRPYREQFVLDTYSSATSFSVAAASGFTASGLGYIISDPVDIDPCMITAFFRCVEKQLAEARDMRNKQEVNDLYEINFKKAAATDSSRVYKPRQVGDGERLGPRPTNEIPPETL